VADFLEGGSTPPRAGSTPARVGAATAGAAAAAATAANRTDRSAKGQQRVENRGARQEARVANRGEMRSSVADSRSERRTARQQQIGQHADQVREGLREHYDDNHLFDDFWLDHPHAHYHFHQNPLFWTWASFNTVQAFMPWNWGSENYYDYGTGGNVYYEGDTVYAGDTTVPADEYAQQAEQIAASVPMVEDVDADGSADVVPNMFLQLAVSKEGIVAGTYENKSTGQTESVEGMVDQKSQRAAWTIVGKNTPIVETGIANLTKGETRVLVHFADGQTQEWLMVHVENPQAATKQ
jgi:hypothetical protein